jgi:hypothetical protein
MFTDEEKILKIGMILKVDSIRLTDHLNFFADRFTSTRNTLIDAELAQWVLVKGNFTRIKAMEANFGAEIGPDDSKRDVRENLESLLLLAYAEWYAPSGSMQFTIERG